MKRAFLYKKYLKKMGMPRIDGLCLFSAVLFPIQKVSECLVECAPLFSRPLKVVTP